MVEKELKNVAAVERALKILDAFRRGEGPLTLTQIAERTMLYKSTVLRLLQTLELYDYVMRTPSGAYRIGVKPLRLAALFQEEVQPQEIVMPVLRDLVAQTGESASFNVPREGMRVCVYRVDSPHTIRDHMRPGDIYPLPLGAAGLILAAYGDPAADEYADIRKTGVATATATVDPDTAGVAAPVFDASGGLAGALAVSGPLSRFDSDALQRFSQEVRNAAARLTYQLGGNVAPLAVERIFPPQ